APVRADRLAPAARRVLGPGPALAVVGLAGLSLGAGWVGTHGVALGVIGALVAVGVLRAVRRHQDAAHARRRAEQVLAACDALASDLVAGQPPSVALDRAAAEWGELLPVATAGQMGADVPMALRELAARPGAAQLRRVAATWQVAHLTGVGLASAMEAAAAAIRADLRTARLVATELAAAHATARMLAVLPLGVLLLGIGVGGDPLGFLLRTTPGVVVLASGLGLSFAGMAWLDRIAERVLHP
ncbi:MAG TPA: hypothetical protein VGI54_02575, partial [Solirubrobacteraceae bacterium]